MKFESLLQLVGSLPSFDLPLLLQAVDDRREVVRTQLARWMQHGKVIGLRRGVYALAEPYRRTPLAPAALAGVLYRPSYLSGLWALGFHDLIPERVVWFTSVTTRPPRRFVNPFGTFDYRNIKQSSFFGYQTTDFGGAQLLVAEPEKALLDHWHLTPGEWTPERLEQMRYQQFDVVHRDRLERYAGRFRSPRLERAVERWLRLAADAGQGTVTL